MAGPGGGPPRKSHTKSRKGCKTCKKRHIRCDETFPQCRNCTKHNCRCDYMDMPAAGEEPMRGSRPPELLMTPELQHILDNWRITGESPFPELRTNDRSYWTRFSTIDLRLVYHIAALSIDLHKRGYSGCTAWASKMPILIAVALSSNFVMSAVLALSASHLAWQTKNPETENLAYYHRGVALKGLHEAIGAFSRDNSEAILAASMLLSWQATEWRSWASLQQGVSTVMNAMRPWAHESELANYLEAQRSIARARTPVTPTIPGTQMQPLAEDLSRLEQATAALHDLRSRLANHEELLAQVDQLLDYLQELRQDFPLQAPEEAFERLQPLRSFLFWLPPDLFRPGESDIGAIAVLSHYFAVALALEPLFPEIGGSYLGGMSIAPLEKMQSIILSRRGSHPQEPGIQVALSLLDVPVQILNAYKSRQRQLAQNMDGYRGSPRSPFAHMQHVATPENQPVTLYSNSPTHSPGNLQVPGASYFPPMVTASTVRRESATGRPPMLSERSSSGGSPLARPQMAYPPHTSGPYDMQSGAGYHHSSSSSPYNSYALDSRFVTPSQLWT